MKIEELTYEKVHCGDKNFHFTPDEWAEVFDVASPGIAISLPLTSIISPRICLFMGRPVIGVADGVVIFVVCEYCGTRDYPDKNFCNKCGAEIV